MVIDHKYLWNAIECSENYKYGQVIFHSMVNNSVRWITPTVHPQHLSNDAIAHAGAKFA